MQHAKHANIRYAPTTTLQRPALGRARAWFSIAPRRLRPTSRKMMSATTGGELCVHHSGP
jgi:hypothetical protein